MDRVQRLLGWVLSGFCAYLLILNPFGRASVGEPLWVPTDWITVGVMILTALTALFKFRGAHAIQILCFVAVGIGALASQSQTVGLIILNAGFFLALFYGWYRIKPLPKVVVTGILFFTLVYAFDKATTNNNFVATLNWMALFIGDALFFWFLYQSKMKDAIIVSNTLAKALEEKEQSNAP
jgi:hypothetical protein